MNWPRICLNLSTPLTLVGLVVAIQAFGYSGDAQIYYYLAALAPLACAVIPAAAGVVIGSALILSHTEYSRKQRVLMGLAITGNLISLFVSVGLLAYLVPPFIPGWS